MELELQSPYAFMMCTGTSFFVTLTRCQNPEALNIPNVVLKLNALVAVTELLFIDPLGRVLHGDATYRFAARHGT